MNKLTLLIISLFMSSSLFATDFITRWDLSIPGSSSNSLTFEVATTGTVNYTWETIPAGSNGSGTFTGTTATITGLPFNAMIRLHIDSTNFNQFRMSISDRHRLMDVEQWGTASWTSMNSAFSGCDSLNITAIDVPDLSQVADMSWMFSECTNLNSPTNINTWNTSNVTNMSYMFHYASSFNQAIGNWNTSNVIYMSWMFRNASSFNQPIGTWNTSNVTDMYGMFFSTDSFNQAIGTWNTSNVTNMSSMFVYAISFNQAIGIWNTSNVTNMSYMFFGANSFNHPIGNWNTSNVTTMNGMFRNASSFNQAIGNWNTSNVIGMTYMFWNASSFNQNLGNWDLNPNVSLVIMLDSCGMDCINYSATLYGWATNASVPSNRNLSAATMHYGTNAVAARTYLVSTKGWYIFAGDIADTVPCGCFSTSYSTSVSICSSQLPYSWNGQTLTSNGVYYDTLMNANGCDSILTLNLTINQPTASTINQAACNSYFFNGQALTSSGVYYDTLMNVNGCDSLITLNLTVNTPNTSVTQAGANLTSNATSATYQWLVCPGFTPIVGETNQSFTASANGDYAVAVTENGCTDTSACYTVIGIGIQEINNASSFSVYPNPVSNTLYIQSSTALTDKKKEFYNSFGQLLFTTKSNKIDVSSFSKGIYYLKCEQHVVKVMVE